HPNTSLIPHKAHEAPESFTADTGGSDSDGAGVVSRLNYGRTVLRRASVALLGLVGGHQKGSHDLLLVAVVEGDGKSVALDRRHFAVPEFLVEHSLAADEAMALLRQAFDGARLQIQGRR